MNMGANDTKGVKDTWQGHGGMCTCGFCGGHGRWHGFFLLRVLITIIIILLIFMAGVRFGELKAYVGGFHNGPMMEGGYRYYNSQPMMGTAPVAPPAPNTPVTVTSTP
jgi:hypothetical protein